MQTGVVVAILLENSEEAETTDIKKTTGVFDKTSRPWKLKLMKEVVQFCFQKEERDKKIVVLKTIWIWCKIKIESFLKFCEPFKS